MPFKRQGSDIYYTKASVAPYGRIPYLLTGFRQKRRAEAAERALQKAARLRLEHFSRGAMGRNWQARGGLNEWCRLCSRVPPSSPRRTLQSLCSGQP